MPKGRPKALLTNAEERSMLAASRSLEQGGYEVSGTSISRLACATWSKSCARRVEITDPKQDAQRFVEELQRELSERPYEVLIPGSDSALLAISRGREHLQELTAIGLPSIEIVERSLERESLARVATEAGLNPAKSIRCAGESEALLAAEELGFPVVLKSTHAARARGGSVLGVPKGQVLDSEPALRRAIGAFDGPLLVQQHLQGGMLSFGGVFAGGRLLASAVSRYIRTWPVKAGSVTFSETIVPPEGLEEAVGKLLTNLGWEGIFELELIDSARAGLVPIDLNPRPYGSMALANAAGAPLAAIWCDWLLGRDPHPVVATPGFRYRWEDGELRHVAWQAAHGHLRGALHALRPHRRVTHASFELGDPVPLLAQGAYLVGKLLAR